MIDNASLLAIVTPGPATTGGDASSSTTQTLGAAGAGVRCFTDEPTRSQLLALTNKIADASFVVFVSKSLVPNVSIAPMQSLTIKVDCDAEAMTLQVLYVRDRQMPGGLSHFECFAKELA